MSTITVTFGWDALGEEERAGWVPLTLQMDKSALAERDPDGTSLLSCKMNFASSTTFSMSPLGPGQDESS